MKLFLVLFLLFLTHSFVFAGKYQKAKIILQNGTELEGMATFPSNPSPLPIFFKGNKDSKRQSINSDDIKTIIFFLKHDKTIEFDRMGVYQDKSNKKINKLWLLVSKRGGTTLYTYDGVDIYTGVNSMTNVFQRYWLCERSGEDAATIIASTSTKNKRDAFVKMALEYFKDDVELTAKIKNNQYKWSDMDQIVDEYNKRK